MPDVVTVIAWGFPLGGVTELQQLWGRGARGVGREARAILFVRSLRVPPPLPQASARLRARAAWEREWLQRLTSHLAGGGIGWDVLELFTGHQEEGARVAAWLGAQRGAPHSEHEDTRARALLHAGLEAVGAAQAAPPPRWQSDAAAGTISMRVGCLLAHAGRRDGPAYDWAPLDASYRGAIPRLFGMCGLEAEHAAESVQTVLALAGYVKRAVPAPLNIVAEATARRRERECGAGHARGSGAGGSGHGGWGGRAVEQEEEPSPTLAGLTRVGGVMCSLGADNLPDSLVRALLQQTRGPGPLNPERHGAWLCGAAARIHAATAAAAHRAAVAPDLELAALLGDPQVWPETLPHGSDARLLTAAVFPRVEDALSAVDARALAALRQASSERGRARAAALRARFEQGERDTLAALLALDADVRHPFGPDAEAAEAEAVRRASIAWLPSILALLRGAPEMHGEPLVRGGGGGMNAAATDMAAATSCAQQGPTTSWACGTQPHPSPPGHSQPRPKRDGAHPRARRGTVLASL